MPFPNPVNLYASLNGTPQTGGKWKLVSATTWDGNLCTSSDGFSYSNQSITLNSTYLAGGSYLVYVDFSGIACGVSKEGDGTYVFSYTVGSGSCTATSMLTIDVVDNVVTIGRTAAVCSYFCDAVNPSTPTNVGKNDPTYNRVAPAVFLQNQYITPRVQYQARVTRSDLEDCISPGYAVAYYQNGILGLSQAAFAAAKGSGYVYGIEAPHVDHYIELNLADWDTNSYVSSIKLYIAGSPVYLDVSYATYSPGSMNAFVTALNAGLAAAMTAITGDNGLYNASFNNTSLFGGDDTLRFTTTCAHNVTGWCGINKSDVEVHVCAGGGCTGDTCGVNGITCVYPSVEQEAAGLFSYYEAGIYTTPCGDDLDIYFNLCPNRSDIELFNLSGCNYNTLAITNVNGRGYDTSVSEGGGPAYSICETISLYADSSDCADPSYEWSPSGTGDTLSPASPDVPYTVTADCEGCEDTSEEFCYPEADDMPVNLALCKEVSVNDIPTSISASNSNCSAGTVDYSSVDFYDVPSIITPSYVSGSNIELAIPADPMPGRYFLAYRVQDSLGRWSNYASLEVNLNRSADCCNELL